MQCLKSTRGSAEPIAKAPNVPPSSSLSSQPRQPDPAAAILSAKAPIPAASPGKTRASSYLRDRAIAAATAAADKSSLSAKMKSRQQQPVPVPPAPKSALNPNAVFKRQKSRPQELQNLSVDHPAPPASAPMVGMKRKLQPSAEAVPSQAATEQQVETVPADTKPEQRPKPKGRPPKSSLSPTPQGPQPASKIPAGATRPPSASGPSSALTQSGADLVNKRQTRQATLESPKTAAKATPVEKKIREAKEIPDPPSQEPEGSQNKRTRSEVRLQVIRGYGHRFWIAAGIIRI